MISDTMSEHLAKTSSLLHLKLKVPDVHGKIIFSVAFERDNVFAERYTCAAQLKDKRTLHKHVLMLKVSTPMRMPLLFIAIHVLLPYVELCKKGKERYLSI